MLGSLLDAEDAPGERVREMCNFVKPGLFDVLGLPRELPLP